MASALPFSVFCMLPPAPEGAFPDQLPASIGDNFLRQQVAGVFAVGLILELCLPKDPKRCEV